MATKLRQMRWLAAVAGVWVLGGCTNSHGVVMPTDGVHITGAINAVYPITDAGTCPLIDMGTSQELNISANPGAGEAFIGAVVANFVGPTTYTDVQWPPEGHSSLYAALGYRSWRADSGLISVTSFENGKASGTVSASHLREVGGSTTVNVAGAWTCRVLLPEPVPSPSPSQSPIVYPSPTPTETPTPAESPTPSPSPLVFPSPSPSPLGSPVARQVLSPATVLSAVDLCSAPIQHYADGGAGPLFCSNGALIVAAWTYYAPIDPNVLSVGPNPTLIAVESAICADGRLHATLPMLFSGYELAAAYYGWNLAFDPEQYIWYGTCP